MDFTPTHDDYNLYGELTGVIKLFAVMLCFVLFGGGDKIEHGIEYTLTS